MSELPDDVETLKRLLIEKTQIITQRDAVISGKDTFIAELEKRNDLLAEQVTLLRKHRFARSSERWTDEDRKQQDLFIDVSETFDDVQMPLYPELSL